MQIQEKISNSNNSDIKNGVFWAKFSNYFPPCVMKWNILWIKFQSFKNSRRLDETFQDFLASPHQNATSDSHASSRFGANFCRPSANLSHLSPADHFQPNFLRQLGPACCTLKILDWAVIYYFEFPRFTLADMSSIWWILFKWIAEVYEVFSNQNW
jgi:hypothetical protein